MLANSLTKIEHDGTVAWLDLRKVLITCVWQPRRVWKLNGVVMRPGASAYTGPEASHSLLESSHMPEIFSLHDDSDVEEEAIANQFTGDSLYDCHDMYEELPMLSCSSFWVFDFLVNT
jgi:hypothetical protein